MLVRAGLFAADVVIEAEREVALNVEDKGRIGTRTSETFAQDIGIAPLRAAEIADGRVTFLLPELTEATSLIAAAWIDENGDGKLTLRADGTLEPAYSPAIESMSTIFYLSTYGYDTEPRGYLAIATADDGDDLVVEDKHLDQFRLEL
ncbi:hypothetical protein [Nannocystis pusilla]|uniref:hypothetical protein n=1 Tax=Nannocystis pusilla TaxID=889268 RepID=UPI003DA51E3F